MVNSQAQKNAKAAPADSWPQPGTECGRAKEIAQDLESLRALAARFRRLAPAAQASVLRALLGKREALLESIRERLDAPAEPVESADAGAGNRDTGFARTLGEVAAMDIESEAALRKRSEETAAEIRKLRAGKKWRLSRTQ